MNTITLKGFIKDIRPSHKIENTDFDKANLIVKRDSGVEDIIDIKFKRFSNKYKENDEISITGNIRSYSYKVKDNKNKVNIYVFTYFDRPETDYSNKVVFDGRICKINGLRVTKNGKHNTHFIVANNIALENSTKRLNSYIPCIVWGKAAKEASQLKVSDKIRIEGELHSREHRKKLSNGEVEISVAHEVFVTHFEVINDGDL